MGSPAWRSVSSRTRFELFRSSPSTEYSILPGDLGKAACLEKEIHKNGVNNWRAIFFGFRCVAVGLVTSWAEASEVGGCRCLPTAAPPGVSWACEPCGAPLARVECCVCDELHGNAPVGHERGVRSFLAKLFFAAAVVSVLSLETEMRR